MKSVAVWSLWFCFPSAPPNLASSTAATGTGSDSPRGPSRSSACAIHQSSPTRPLSGELHHGAKSLLPTIQTSSTLLSITSSAFLAVVLLRWPDSGRYQSTTPSLPIVGITNLSFRFWITFCLGFLCAIGKSQVFCFPGASRQEQIGERAGRPTD
ncbi:hypothetical protein CSPX01_17051 [Colletotrichum filicis]|nr:hypothetical protein CSPX01_17051 [Colletotrichum filicis]